MASERAKELAKQQKAEAKALKAAKRNSSDPRDWGTMKQLREAWRVTAEVDKKMQPLVLGTLAGYTVIGLAIGLIIDATTGSHWQWLWFLILGLLVGLSLGMWIFTRRIKSATYLRYADQAGSGEVALSMLDAKKFSYTPAITFNRQQDMVHRVVGAPGIVLVGDGDPNRLRPLLVQEKKRHEQVLYGVPVNTIQIGDGEGQVPLKEVAKNIQKMPKKLDNVQIAEAESRMKALDSVRQRLPLPKGPMPNARGSRRAMRGR